MRIIEKKKITDLKTDWENLMPSRDGLIYLTYPFHLMVYESFRLYRLTRIARMKNDMKLRYICLKKDHISAILPVVIQMNEKKIRFAGEWAGAGYNDFIGGEPEDEVLIIRYLKQTYPEYELNLNDIHRFSRINDTYQTEVLKQCYSIPICHGYENWLASLSANTRSNVHKMYSRLQREGIRFDFDVKDRLSRKDIRTAYALYRKHLNEIYRREGKQIAESAVRSFADRYLPMYIFTPIFRGINKIDRCKVAYTKSENKIVSFMILYEECDGMIMPKCAYDTAYSRYKPGIYTMAETIRALAVPGKEFDFDLSRSYHEYKVQYGGQPYPNYCLKV